jgi:hypothetical protein
MRRRSNGEVMAAGKISQMVPQLKAVSFQRPATEVTNHNAFEIIAMISGEPRAIAKSSGVM